MSFEQFFAEEDINQLGMGFNSALFINVPKFEKSIQKDILEKEILSAESTPDHNRLMELNKSFVNNLLSKDLIKRLEEGSPFKISNCELEGQLNKKFNMGRNKLCFDEEDNDFDDLECEDSETKASKISKYSKDSKESFFSVDGSNLKRSNNSCLNQKNEENSPFLPEPPLNFNYSYRAAKSFEHKSDIINDLKFNLLKENKFDLNDLQKSIKEDSHKTNKINLDPNMIINNQLNCLFKNNEDNNNSQILNFSPDKQSSKFKLQENNSEKKNIPIGFSNNMMEFDPKMGLNNNKFSNSEKKNSQPNNQSMNFLNYINYNQSNNVNNVNKGNHTGNNCFFPNNNNFPNFNLINSAFPNINQSGNLNINFFNYQNFLAMNLTNNLMKTNMGNNIQNNNNNFENSAYINRIQDMVNKSTKFPENGMSDPYGNLRGKKFDKIKKHNNFKEPKSDFNPNEGSNLNGILRNKENNPQKNFKKEFRKETNNSEDASNYFEFPDIRKDKQNKFNKGKQGVKNVETNNKKKKPFIEREGDWVCYQCKNLNFSFRLTCNRCEISKEENEKIFKKNSAEMNKLSISSDKNSYDRDNSDN